MKGSMIGKETPRKPAIVLVVDDESAIVAAFTETLQLEGYEAVPAHSAEDGLRLLDDGLMPDAVLLDLRMPGNGRAWIPALPARTSGPTEDSRSRWLRRTRTWTTPRRRRCRRLARDLCFKPMTMQDVLTLAARLIAPNPDFESRRLLH